MSDQAVQKKPLSPPVGAPAGTPVGTGPQQVMPVAAVPPGYVLVRRDSPEEIRARKEEKLQEVAIECALPLNARCQKTMDAKYPVMPGMKRWQVTLADRNGNPTLIVPAQSARAARAPYEDVCGISSVEDPEKKYVVHEYQGAA